METHVGSGYYKRGYCRARKKFIENHSMRTCLECKALYMKEFRKRKPLTKEQKIKE